MFDSDRHRCFVDLPSFLRQHSQYSSILSENGKLFMSSGDAGDDFFCSHHQTKATVAHFNIKYNVMEQTGLPAYEASSHKGWTWRWRHNSLACIQLGCSWWHHWRQFGRHYTSSVLGGNVLALIWLDARKQLTIAWSDITRDESTQISTGGAVVETYHHVECPIGHMGFLGNMLMKAERPQ